MLDTLRTFFAIELPDPIRAQAITQTASLKRDYPHFKWVGEQNLHITLAFLGNVEASKIDSIIELAQSNPPPESPFELRLTNFGTFPNAKRPRVLWLGIDNAYRLAQLAQWSADITKQLDIAADNSNPFHAHVTVARIPKPPPSTLQTALDTAPEWPSDAFQVCHVSLFTSTLTPNGPQYNRIETFPLS